jgi:hypothetical protein
MLTCRNGGHVNSRNAIALGEFAILPKTPKRPRLLIEAPRRDLKGETVAMLPGDRGREFGRPSDLTRPSGRGASLTNALSKPMLL